MRFCIQIILVFFLLGCGEDTKPQQNTSTKTIELSGIKPCDDFVKAACACAEKDVLPIQETCSMAQVSTDGWRAIAEIPEQRDAAAKACDKAYATLENYGCGK